MELLEGIEKRKAIRAFKSEAIPKNVLETILKVALRSPSYANTQPWEIFVVSGRKRDDLSKALIEKAKSNAPAGHDIPTPKGWPEKMDKRMHDHGARRLDLLGVKRDDAEMREKLRIMNFEFYGAPVVIFLCLDKALGSWSIFDTGLFVQNIILAAYSFGIGSCIQASVVAYPDEIRKIAGIPDNKNVIVAIALGYPDDKAKINEYTSLRADFKEFVTWCGI